MVIKICIRDFVGNSAFFEWISGSTFLWTNLVFQAVDEAPKNDVLCPCKILWFECFRMAVDENNQCTHLLYKSLIQVSATVNAKHTEKPGIPRAEMWTHISFTMLLFTSLYDTRRNQPQLNC